MKNSTATATRFVRRTQLAPGEYRKNFHQIDREIIEAVTSAEADRVTPLMSKIYLRLVNASPVFFERDGVLRFVAEEREGKNFKAWLVLCETLGVSSATANKALSWLHEQGIIGYFAGKNGVGIRIFLNRASSSVGKKILPFRAASPDARHGSPNETAFIDSFAVLENLEIDYPRRGTRRDTGHHSELEIPTAPTGESGILGTQPNQITTVSKLTAETTRQFTATRSDVSVAEIAREVVASYSARERESIRDWLENRGLPKVARVVQREVLDTLRRNGLLTETKKARAGVCGAARETGSELPRRLADDEITELAAACVSMLEVQGRPVKQTISDLGAARGGFVLEDDLVAIDRAARRMLASSGSVRA